MIKEIPNIEVKGNVLTISITADELKFIVEQNADCTYKVIDSEMFLNDFATNLEDYQSSNSVEKGMTYLQALFDEIVGITYTNGSEAILDTDDNSNY